MALRVLVVPDKFKGTLTAREAVAAMVTGWHAARPHDVLDELPMSDGGDGFGEVIGGLLSAERKLCATVDSAGRAREAEWWLHPRGRVAVIESAQVNGLALLGPGGYHPFQLDTFGLGGLLTTAEREGVERVYVGLGGSATNDGGFGLARALGCRFFDAAGSELGSWTQLDCLARLSPPPRRLSFAQLTIAVDVNNPLLGESGATRVYGPQKGLTPADIPKAEACLRRLAEIVSTSAGSSFGTEPGAGAAGGLGFGLRAFCDGTFESGAVVFASLSGLEQRILDADLVLTGEGTLDAQSFMGKGVGMVAAAAARAGKPCWCLAGAVSVALPPVPWSGFQSFSIVPASARPSRAELSAADGLRELATLAALGLGSL